MERRRWIWFRLPCEELLVFGCLQKVLVVAAICPRHRNNLLVAAVAAALVAETNAVAPMILVPTPVDGRGLGWRLPLHRDPGANAPSSNQLP